ncbi:MAG: nuclear transport factor 2 family protein, partial [Deltaproteobacteria bacterium]|nr:nuclear transport factor 2 family protein [Deltaproteobacteria bacterium]
MSLAAALLLPACEDEWGPERPAGASTSGGEEEEEAQQSAEHMAMRVVLDQQVEAVRRGDGERFAAPFVSDVFVFGPFAAHTLTDRAALAAAITETFSQYLDPDRPASIRRQGVRLGITESRRAGWAFDTVSVVARGVETNFAVSTLFVREGSAWKIATQVWAPPVEDDMAQELASADQWPAPAPVQEDVGEGTASIRAHARAFVDGRETWPSGERTDSMMVGTSGTLVRGDAAIGEEIARLRRGGTRIGAAGGVITRRVGDGSAGYAAWIGTLTLPRRPAPIRMPVRSLELYVRDGSGYRVVLRHLSLGAPGFRPNAPSTAPSAPAPSPDA